MKFRSWLFTLAIAAAPLQASTMFSFTDIGQGVNASGTLSAQDNGDGTFTALTGTGILNGDPLTLIANPNQTQNSYSASGYFIFDDQLMPTQNPSITNGGLLFQTQSGQELNIYSNGPGDYTTYLNDGRNWASVFTLQQIPNAPEPATVSMLASGLALIGLAVGMKKKARSESEL